jgi:type II secretory pathway pseudopilin PulG
MGIIGVLTTVISVIAIGNNIQKGNDARRKADLESIRSALEVYKNDHGFYPPNGNTGGWCTQLSNPLYQCGAASSVACELTSGGYMTAVPKDPTHAGTNQDYFYTLGGPNNNKTYTLDADMDVISNQNGTYNRSRCANGSVYNYEIANP